MINTTGVKHYTHALSDRTPVERWMQKVDFVCTTEESVAHKPRVRKKLFSFHDFLHEEELDNTEAFLEAHFGRP